jgi:hypothetical protein
VKLKKLVITTFPAWLSSFTVAELLNLKKVFSRPLFGQSGEVVDVLNQLKASGVEADIEMMANHFGVSKQDFINQVVKDIQEEGSSDGSKSLQRISERIDTLRRSEKPKLTLVSG